MTAYREAETLRRALDAVLPQLDNAAQVIVVCPDDETAEAAAAYDAVTVIRDTGTGKPAALNLGLKAARSAVIIMTDGDVTVAPGALPRLLTPFDDPQVGAVSGRPISISPRNTMLGYWSHLLTDVGAHTERLKRQQSGRFFVCSGYLYAIRAGLIDAIPEDALAEDAVISHRIGEQGYRVAYAPESHVYVKYPDSYADWLKQRVRSAGGYVQPYVADSPLQMRSFRHELAASGRALTYPRSLREFIWTLLLYLARLHLWALIAWRVRIQRRPLTELWQRVESTK